MKIIYNLRLLIIVMIIRQLSAQCGITFTLQKTYPTGSQPRSVAAADFDSDGNIDLVVANSGANTISIFLNSGNGTFTTHATYQVGSNPNSVAAFDVNYDNKSDIIVANNGASSISVLLNLGNGTFAAQKTYPTDSQPNSIAAADVDGDGKLDIIIAHYGPSKVGVLLNTGNGTFMVEKIYATGSLPLSAAAADVNGDGKLDIIVSNSGSNYINILLNAGNGTFFNQITHTVGSYPKFIAAADVNGDGKVDIIVPKSGANAVSVLLNAGNGTFHSTKDYSTGNYPLFATVADVNTDDKPDIIVTNTNAYSVGVLLNMGNGSFVTQMTYPTISRSYSLVVADINNDNETDIIMTNFDTNNIGILFNTANGTFIAPTTYPTGSSPVSLIAVDANNDNETDVIVTNRDTNSIGVFLNRGNGTFAVQRTYSTSSSPVSVTTADINGDGKPDLIVANSGSNNVEVFLNSGNGTFVTHKTYSVGSHPNFVLAADVNNDNKSDIIVVNNGANNISILLNLGNGTFATQTTYSTDSQPNSAAVADVDGDGRNDIIVTNQDANNIGVLLNTGNGTFAIQTTYVTDSQPKSVVAVDINDDGRIDIVVGNFGANNISVFINLGNGTFTAQTTYSTGFGPVFVTATDINYDNKIDLIAVSSYTNNINVLLNLGNSTFTNEIMYSTCSWPSSLAVADFNGDNTLDIIVAHQGANSIGVFLSPTRTEQTTSIAKVISTAMFTTLKVSSINPGCFPPKLTLIPGISTLLSPIVYRRSEDFSIASIIEFNCNQSLSMRTQWIIKNCNSTCLYKIQLDPTIDSTFSELFIPRRTLSYGLYELNFTVTMTNISNLSSSSIIYIQIVSSDIAPNLIQYGTSMITRGYQQDLQLDPGRYSIDPDEEIFNTSNWEYKYYCRIYGLYQYPNLNNSLLTIDDLQNDSSNPSCLANRTGLKFNNSIQSSLTILSDSLQPNQTYQFMVKMKNRQNSSLPVTGYILVKVVDTYTHTILLGCVISTMCQSDGEFQLLNPTTQVALFSICDGNCTSLQNITWNIYYGQKNSSLNVIIWTLFNQTNSYENIWFFGINTNNFTATNQLFLSNSHINIWRFEVVYQFSTEISISALHFILNELTSNGSCSINPLNGTTSDLFTISCHDWYDENRIKEYAVLVWTDHSTEKIIIAYSSVSTFQVRLPAGDNQTSLLHLMVQIRDQCNNIIELNISSVTVFSDSIAMIHLTNDIHNLSGEVIANPIIQLLASENQNIVGQLLISISQQFNQVNDKNMDTAVSSGISISSLTDSNRQQIISLNQSALVEYQKELNSHATVRDYLIRFTTKLLITTSNSIKLQALSLSQLTKATNELTRTALTIASDRCYQLAMALYLMRARIPYEDVQTASTDLVQCASNILTAVNGPLQQRTMVLDLDSLRASSFPEDYDTDIEFDWSNPNLFADGNDFSWETIQKNRNLYYQKQLANQITNQMNEVISLLTSSLNIHLNIAQDFLINTSQVYMSIETKSSAFFSNKFIKQIKNGYIELPENFYRYFNNNNEKVSIRSIMCPLASFGNSSLSSNTDLSRSLSLSITDQNQNEISIQTIMNNSIEIIIPRDPKMIIPSMILYNVTSVNYNSHHFIFHYHYLELFSSVSVSIHWEIQPLNTSVAYLFIYKFDGIPQLNSSVNQIDGWILLCPFDLINDSIYRHFLDNQKTSSHQSVVFGIRELNSTEINKACSNSSTKYLPITNERFNFTSNYQMRIYTSGCYYLDKNNQWKSDGLLVGSLTNYYQTQCYSTHLTS